MINWYTGLFIYSLFRWRFWILKARDVIQWWLIELTRSSQLDLSWFLNFFQDFKEFQNFCNSGPDEIAAKVDHSMHPVWLTRDWGSIRFLLWFFGRFLQDRGYFWDFMKRILKLNQLNPFPSSFLRGTTSGPWFKVEFSCDSNQHPMSSDSWRIEELKCIYSTSRMG